MTEFKKLIPRRHLENIKRFLKPQKVVIIYGPRRSGKTTLIKKFSEGFLEPYLFVSGDDIHIQSFLSSQSIEKLRSFIGKNKLLIIDEAQAIKNIGINLKLAVDHIDGLSIIATGSSSFDLSQEVGEPLTGRSYHLKLYPIAQCELSKIENIAQTTAHLEERLIYGSYPEVLTEIDIRNKEIYLREIVSSYLLKDILMFEGVKHSQKLLSLLQLLAYQIGKEVSVTELGTNLGISKNTVDRYLDLLEKTFVITKIRGFSRNLRKEITKNSRYYFLDNGIRNAIINNFNPLNLRNDVGMLWENYIITERIKLLEFNMIPSNLYFWRTYDKKEIDLIEERDGNFYGYEIKWSGKMPKPPKEWIEVYDGQYKIINQSNYYDFLTDI